MIARIYIGQVANKFADKFVKVNAKDQPFRVIATLCCSYLEKSPKIFVYCIFVIS